MVVLFETLYPKLSVHDLPLFFRIMFMPLARIDNQDLEGEVDAKCISMYFSM